jgi:hypothetical protein
MLHQELLVLEASLHYRLIDWFTTIELKQSSISTKVFEVLLVVLNDVDVYYIEIPSKPSKMIWF